MENYSCFALDRTFAALSEPTRRTILNQLVRGQEVTVTELARHLPIKLPTVLKHLNVLTQAGLVEREKRGRTVRVRLTPDPLKEAADWLTRYEGFWTQSLDRLTEIAEAREDAKRSSERKSPPKARGRS
ncbi:MAG: helix-turn-helix transcriptional regulator [Sphingomonadaceae bacterium]|nr:helix-turn-helix transcriptional regulator [Sphingomonadaceae bacterium]